MNNGYTNWRVLADMLRFKFACIEWVRKEELLCKIKKDNKELFEYCWEQLKGKPIEYENFARGVR